ncbi:MAG: PEP-CTERM sorting domain-containing protein [Okeania sp. SIO3B5]|uniref:PEP-CTERM sorting domain-containing protein n=1 Tax=Okeania sp. SIO3B5 TaxID=2607811 RepID=UPI0013FE8A0B|nr:PEP-CTERM sorting domain-containing protein [Okeania sp. SIO3B5]NEO54796.1 PEP-CTERM sorting domain-containing protein [Okeania sp. SIO3B5]
MKNYQFKSFTRTSLIAFGLSLLGAPAFAFDLTINPPPSLTIDGMAVTEGVFTLQSAMGYSSTTNSPFSLINDPVKIDAIIGGNNSSTNLLIPDVPDDIEVLRLMGNFDPADLPDMEKPAAFFDITLFGFNDGIDDFTYFLPSMSGPVQAYQVTDLGATTALGDNINTFTSAAPIIDSDFNVIIPPGSVIGTSTGNFCGPPVVNFHGGGGGTPPPRCVPVPEPGSAMGIFALGLLGIGSMLKRQQKS